MHEDHAPAPLAGIEHVAVRRGQAGILEIERAAGRAAAVVGQGLDVLFGEAFEERGIAVVSGRDDVAEPDVPAVAVVGVVAGEKVHEGVDRDVVNIALASRDDFQSGAVGPDPDDPSAEKLERLAVLPLPP